ncbi:MAG TPA: hypothetical protein VFK13_07740 [Gemmatimonadaceae bacterium]|nr:hypothetical protein [Gemmatimonadaceae bacterium]
MDTLLESGAAPQQLAPGDTSAVRWLEIAVHPGVHMLRATLWSEAATVGNVVPLVPPDSEPASLYDFDNLTADSLHWSGLFVRDIVALHFLITASQSDRQSAVEAVNGIVVGGANFGNGDGLYLVSLPADPTNETLFDAIGRLRALPQVTWAMPDWVIIGGTTWLRPDDGLGMHARDYRLNPDSAFGSGSRRTWALEAINAPFAWGCSTGDSTRIGVVDMGIHAVGDIVPNIIPGTPSFQPDSFTHGTAVASVIAARGNDSSGIAASCGMRSSTYMMWLGGTPMARLSIQVAWS